VTEVAEALGEPRADVEEALAAEGCFTPSSLDRTVGDESETPLGELLRDPDDSRAAAEARIVLAPVVRRLSERDRTVLRLRFFEDMTQQEIAQAIGVTQTQVSRVLGRIFEVLREELGRHHETSAESVTG
jgi:RNA polymerase sigma-B factor